MMRVDEADAVAADDPAIVIGRYLRHDDAVIRCAAAKALGAAEDVEAAPALVDALLDEDPDVRTDAMEALIRCARPEDAEAIRRSLEGDPVQEVKVFAIEALARLQDKASIPLLRALAGDRTEEQVAWEDEAGMWDDWLDVQTASITALGRLQASEAIDDLLDARTDEMGQELDIVVFAALADIEEGGLAALFALLRDRDPKVRERVIRALSKARPEAMLPMQAILLRDANPRVRLLAIGTLQPDDQAVSDLVLEDTDAAVRAAALTAFAEARPDLVIRALRDSDEQVLTVAIRSLPADLDTAIADDLAANLQAWMETGGPALAAASATALAALSGEKAAGGLRRLAAEDDRPIEPRIAALQALADLPSETVLATLGERIEDPVRQIRTAALASLAAIARRRNDPHRDMAGALLAAAIRGELGADVEVETFDPAAGGGDVGAPKMEGGKGRITISADGDIIRSDDDFEDEPARGDNVIEGRFPTSTLDAIQTLPTVTSPIGEDEEPAPGEQPVRKKRVAVDGPDDVGQDIRIVALGMAGDGHGPEVDAALVDALACSDQPIRRAAFKALAQRSDPGKQAEAMLEACMGALAAADAAIRGDAATFLAAHALDAADRLSPYAEDPDPLLRSVVLKVKPLGALRALGDPSPLVRREAMKMLIDSADATTLRQAVDICFDEHRADTLKVACNDCAGVQQQVLASLGTGQLASPQLRIALEALAPS